MAKPGDFTCSIEKVERSLSEDEPESITREFGFGNSKHVVSQRSTLHASNPKYANISLDEFKGRDKCDIPRINEQYPGLQAVHKEPWIFIVNNLLTPAECGQLVVLGGSLMRKAVNFKPRGKDEASKPGQVNLDKRKALQSLLDPSLPAVVDIQTKFSKLLNIPQSHFEALKVSNYPEGGKFGMHLDSAPSREKGIGYCATPHCTRIATLIVYLTDVTGGGATKFLDLNNKTECRSVKTFLARDDRKELAVAPEQGMGLLFFPGSCPTAAENPGAQQFDLYHEAMETKDDSKWVCQQWVWPGEYDLIKAGPQRQPYTWNSSKDDAAGEAMPIDQLKL